MKQAFLSYAREDIKKARRLSRELRRTEKIRVWFDKDKILAGMQWEPAIRKAIRDSRYFLSVLSHRSSTNRGFQSEELHEALEVAKEFPPHSVFVIPTRLDECGIPPELKKYQCADLFPKWREGLTQICKSLRIKAPVRGKPRSRQGRKPRATRTPQVRISYKVGLLDLGRGVQTIGTIAKGLNRVQSTFHFTSERFATPRKALAAMGRRRQLYISQLPKTFHKRIGLIQTDYVVCLSRPLLAFDEGDYVYSNYLSYESPSEKRISFVSYADLEEYSREAGVTLNSALAFVVTAELVDHFLDLGYHKQTRNCPMDFSMNHSDLVGGLRAGHFCRYCSRTLNNSKPFGDAFKAMIAWGR